MELDFLPFCTYFYYLSWIDILSSFRVHFFSYKNEASKSFYKSKIYSLFSNDLNDKGNKMKRDTKAVTIIQTSLTKNSVIFLR